MTEPPPRRAVALRYVAGSQAPRVVAKGEGALAEALLARAQAGDVPVHEDAELAQLLGQLDLDTLIPPALYAAVIEVLAWAYAAAGRGPPTSGPP